MGKVTGFLEIDRQDRSYKPVEERIGHYDEFVIPLGDEKVKAQASRCMDCGIPFCHTGCPVNNQIPDWNDLVYNDDWEIAAQNLHSTNNFPEFTGRVCPAPCEAACTLNLENTPVSIKTIECAIVDKAFENGWVKPVIAATNSGKRVAVVGSGPAGMAAAQQLARAGHDVHLYEKNNQVGGLLRYGIPDFKLDKKLIERRAQQMAEEGVVFHTGVNVGVDKSIQDLRDEYDALLLTGGSESPRDLPIEGRDLDGIHFAMDFLTQQNRRNSNESVSQFSPISAEGKHVVVIGGGDTGSDCIGTSIRQHCTSVTQLEIMPKPPEMEDKLMTWPNWPLKMRTSSSQAEGTDRDWSVMTSSFEGTDGKVTEINCVRVDEKMQAIAGTEFKLKADLVLLAMGFVHPKHEGMIETLGVELDGRGNVLANVNEYKTSLDGVFAAGDMRRGQSLVVWAIREGRQAARSIDEFLTGSTILPR